MQRGCAVTCALSQALELTDAIPLLDRLPDIPLWVVADRSYSAHAFREQVWTPSARPAIRIRESRGRDNEATEEQ